VSGLHLIIPLLLLFVGALGLCPGCTLFGAFAPAEIVRHPDAPMLILEAKGEYVRVAIYDSESNNLVEYGWILSSEVKGWTISKYDWEKFINRRRNGNR